ncbi:MAG: hypothetical protein H6942_03690 [Candidatus Accumulibacter sp.]|uniref:hypothetical protein n=1 Tax=Accumulibacter sp. TaxID=2053492 RepID=UPI0025FDA719|nr:hypothetical protein [Accumulibacter sp.]MCP5247640.1 hypothetical protein [Accumulibacter sp.]
MDHQLSATPGASGAGPEIEFRRIQAISCRGNLRIRVAPCGALFAYVETRDCPRGEHWSAPWPGEPLRRLQHSEQQQLAEALLGGGFFALPGEIVTPGRDGFRDEIDATLGAMHHSVRIERSAAPTAFARVRAALMAFAGPPFSA